MNPLLLFLALISTSIYPLAGLNLSYYSVVPVPTNPFNVSAFNACVCACLTCFDCRYFSYWSSSSTPTCQLYTLTEGKPDINNYTTINNDTATGVYLVSSTSTMCTSWITSSSFSYSNEMSLNISMSGSRIISMLIMTIDGRNQILAINGNNFTYHVFDTVTFQMTNNGTFSPTGCIARCAIQSNNLLYIGCTFNFIEVRKFILNRNSSREEPIVMYTLSTTTGGAPEGLAILNNNTLYYVTSTGYVYVLLTQSNSSILIYQATGNFNSPSIVLTLDSVNMALFLVSYNGKLFRIQLSSNATNNGTALSGDPGAIDQYQLPLNAPTSIILDGCNRLWVLSSPASAIQLTLFDQQASIDHSFASMTMINLTQSLPHLNSPYNFMLDENYSLYTANVELGAYVVPRRQLC